MSQTPALSYIRQGMTPFFRLPQIDHERPTPYAGLDAVVVGIPFDAATTYHPGARFAPYEVRKVSALVQSFHPAHKIDVFAAIKAADGGNIAVPPFTPPVAREVIEHGIAAIAGAGAVPFVVGGDHSVALPAMRAVMKKHGPLAVVHVDAHLDTSDGAVWGDDYHHGTPLRHAIQEGLVERGQLYQIGMRATWGDPREGNISADHGASRFDIDALASIGVAEAMARVVGSIGARPVYVTFDIDAVDPAFAPGTGTPVPGGMTSREAVAVLRALGGVRLVGMDLVEVCPARDHADITSHLAAHLVYEGLAALAVGRARSSGT
jgi:agmatinase